MTEPEHTGQQWVRYVEDEFAMNRHHVTLPQNSISIDDAVNLAFRLNIELILVEDSFIFVAADQNTAEHDSYLAPVI